MKHIQLEIIANEYQQEELIALFDECNATGFEQTDEKLIAYFTAEDFTDDAIKKIVEGYRYDITEIAERNWNEVWEQNFQPVIVDDFVGVRAHFHQPIEQVEQEIVITPKMSFGTGHHATTYMMMAQMRGLDFSEKIVFDFGTGTGILSILAEKLGAAKIVAVDVDDWSIENAKENFARNNCSNIAVTLSTQIPDELFDIILANINRNVILDYMPRLLKVLRKNAQVLFSGLLLADESEINASAEVNGLTFVTRMERQGWISLLYVNQP